MIFTSGRLVRRRANRREPVSPWITMFIEQYAIHMKIRCVIHRLIPLCRSKCPIIHLVILHEILCVICRKNLRRILCGVFHQVSHHVTYGFVAGLSDALCGSQCISWDSQAGRPSILFWLLIDKSIFCPTHRADWLASKKRLSKAITRLRSKIR